MIEAERPEGVIVQFGGQTPLKIAMDLDRALKANPIPAASGEHTVIACMVRLSSRNTQRVRQGLASAPYPTSPARPGYLTAQPGLLRVPCSLSFPCTKPTNHASSCLLFHPPGNGNVRIWGTSPESIDIAEDRDRWMELLTKLNIRQPAGGSAR